MAVVIRSMKTARPGYVICNLTRSGDVLAVNTGGTLNAAAVVIDEHVGCAAGDVVEFELSFAEVPGPGDWYKGNLRAGLENRVVRWMRFRMPGNPAILYGELPRIMVQVLALDRGIEIVTSDALGAVEALMAALLTVHIRNERVPPEYFDQEMFFSGLTDLIHLEATSIDSTGLAASLVRRRDRDLRTEFGDISGPPYRLACRGKRTGSYTVRMVATDAAGRRTVNTVQVNV